MNPTEMTITAIGEHLDKGGSFSAAYETYSASASRIEDGAYAVVLRNRDGSVAVADGAAGVVNLLRVMEQYSALSAWEASS